MTPYGDYPDLASVARVLVIKLRHHGDVLLASPVFAALHQRLPSAEIDALVNLDTRPMLDGHPAITSIHVYDNAWRRLSRWSRMGAELALVRTLRTRRYDLVLNLTEGDRGAITGWLTGARFRVGWIADVGGHRTSERLYTHVVKRSRLPRHMVEQNLDAVRRVGVFPDPEERDLFFHVPDEARAAVRQRLLAAGLTQDNYVVVHPTSRWLFKCWPVGRVAEVIDDLQARGRVVVLSAAPDDRELAMIDEIRSRCRAPVASLAGQLGLKELGALIEASQGLLSVDSLPAHLASALHRPCVVLFGPSSDVAWGPWRNSRARVVAQDFSCRPCNLDGCGGSKVSDCLDTLPLGSVRDVLNEVLGSA